MKPFVSCLLAAIGLIGPVRANPATGASHAEIPAADFFRPAYLHSPMLNPAGTHIAAFVTGTDEKRQLMVIDLATKSRKVVGGRGSKDIGELFWLTNDTMVFGLFADPGHQQAVLAARLRNLDQPYPLFQYGEPQLVAVPQANPLRPIYWMKVDGYLSKAGLYELNAELRTGRVVDAEGGLSRDLLEALSESNARHVTKAFVEPSGEVIRYAPNAQGDLAFGWTVKDGRESLHVWDGKSWTLSPVDLDVIDLVSIGEQPDELVASRAADHRPGEVRLLNARTGEWGELLFADEAYNFSGKFFRHPRSGKIVGTIFHRAGAHSEWFSNSYQNLQRALNAGFPGKFVEILDANEAETIFAFAVYSDREPASYYVTDLTKRSMTLIAAARPWIDAARMQPVRMLPYSTDNNAKLDAYLTLPAGASPEKPAPLVILVQHETRHTWQYDQTTQFFASRGYAVLRPNHRGSFGYRWRLTADFDFAAMERDVASATRAAIQTGLIDPNRTALVGHRDGAYLAALGLIENPDLYRCAATISGLFDLTDLARAGKSRRYSDPHLQRTVRRIDTATTARVLDSLSMMNRAAEFQRPVLVAYGDEALLAAPGQSRQFVKALKSANREVQEVAIKEKIWDMSSGGSARLFSEIDAFIRRQNAH